MQERFALPAMPAEVERVFAMFNAPVRFQLLQVRELIFSIAATTPGIGAVAETLKWGEPAYLTQETGSGTTIRLGQTKISLPQSAVFFNCRTTLIDTCRSHFADAFTYQGTRALLLDPTRPLAEEPLSLCLALALTYHRKGGKRGSEIIVPARIADSLVR